MSLEMEELIETGSELLSRLAEEDAAKLTQEVKGGQSPIAAQLRKTLALNAAAKSGGSIEAQIDDPNQKCEQEQEEERRKKGNEVEEREQEQEQWRKDREEEAGAEMVSQIEELIKSGSKLIMMLPVQTAEEFLEQVEKADSPLAVSVRAQISALPTPRAEAEAEAEAEAAEAEAAAAAEGAGEGAELEEGQDVEELLAAGEELVGRLGSEEAGALLQEVREGASPVAATLRAALSPRRDEEEGEGGGEEKMGEEEIEGRDMEEVKEEQRSPDGEEKVQEEERELAGGGEKREEAGGEDMDRDPLKQEGEREGSAEGEKGGERDLAGGQEEGGEREEGGVREEAKEEEEEEEEEEGAVLRREGQALLERLPAG
eukprot:38774-Rhodomonas_salina.2